TDAADDRRPLPRLTARENAKRQIGKMQAGPKHGEWYLTSVAGAAHSPSMGRVGVWVKNHPAAHFTPILSFPRQGGRDTNSCGIVSVSGRITPRGSGPGTRRTSSARASAR